VNQEQAKQRLMRLLTDLEEAEITGTISIMVINFVKWRPEKKTHYTSKKREIDMATKLDWFFQKDYQLFPKFKCHTNCIEAPCAKKLWNK